MSAWNKAFAAVLRNSPRIVVSLILIVACGLAYKFYSDNQETTRRYEQLVGKTADYEQLTDSLAKLRTKYATQDELKKKLLEDWAEAVDENGELKGRIKALADATFEGGTDTQNIELRGKLLRFSTHFCCKDNPSSYADAHGPAVANSILTGVEIRDGKLGAMMWQTEVVEHEIKIQAAITKDESTGEVRILTKAFWIQKEDGFADTAEMNRWKGVPYPLNITGGSIVIDPTEPIDITLKNKFRLAPHLNTGPFTGVASSGEQYGGHVDFSLWGYGKTKNDLEFKLGQIGLNFSKNYVDANLIPVSYNIGIHIPLISDLYIGPGIGYGTEGRIFFVTLSKTL